MNKARIARGISMLKATNLAARAIKHVSADAALTAAERETQAVRHKQLQDEYLQWRQMLAAGPPRKVSLKMTCRRVAIIIKIARQFRFEGLKREQNRETALQKHAIDRSKTDRVLVKEVLLKYKFFKALQDDQIEYLCRTVTKKTLHKGEMLFVEGEKPLAAYVVASGVISIFKTQKQTPGLPKTPGEVKQQPTTEKVMVSEHYTGEQFGQGALSKGEHHKHETMAKATVPTSVFVIDRGTFQQVLYQMQRSRVEALASFYRKMPLLQPLPESEDAEAAINLMAMVSIERSAATGAVMAQEGEEDDTRFFYVIRSGVARVLRVINPQADEGNPQWERPPTQQKHEISPYGVPNDDVALLPRAARQDMDPPPEEIQERVRRGKSIPLEFDELNVGDHFCRNSPDTVNSKCTSVATIVAASETEYYVLNKWDFSKIMGLFGFQQGSPFARLKTQTAAYMNDEALLHMWKQGERWHAYKKRVVKDHVSTEKVKGLTAMSSVVPVDAAAPLFPGASCVTVTLDMQDCGDLPAPPSQAPKAPKVVTRMTTTSKCVYEAAHPRTAAKSLGTSPEVLLEQRQYAEEEQPSSKVSRWLLAPLDPARLPKFAKTAADGDKLTHGLMSRNRLGEHHQGTLPQLHHHKNMAFNQQHQGALGPSHSEPNLHSARPSPHPPTSFRGSPGPLLSPSPVEVQAQQAQQARRRAPRISTASSSFLASAMAVGTDPNDSFLRLLDDVSMAPPAEPEEQHPLPPFFERDEGSSTEEEREERERKAAAEHDAEMSWRDLMQEMRGLKDSELLQNQERYEDLKKKMSTELAKRVRGKHRRTTVKKPKIKPPSFLDPSKRFGAEEGAEEEEDSGSEGDDEAGLDAEQLAAVAEMQRRVAYLRVSTMMDEETRRGTLRIPRRTEVREREALQHRIASALHTEEQRLAEDRSIRFQVASASQSLHHGAPQATLLLLGSASDSGSSPEPATAAAAERAVATAREQALQQLGASPGPQHSEADRAAAMQRFTHAADHAEAHSEASRKVGSQWHSRITAADVGGPVDGLYPEDYPETFSQRHSPGGPSTGPSHRPDTYSKYLELGKHYKPSSPSLYSTNRSSGPAWRHKKKEKVRLRRIQQQQQQHTRRPPNSRRYIDFDSAPEGEAGPGVGGGEEAGGSSSQRTPLPADAAYTITMAESADTQHLQEIMASPPPLEESVSTPNLPSRNDPGDQSETQDTISEKARRFSMRPQNMRHSSFAAGPRSNQPSPGLAHSRSLKRLPTIRS